MSDSVFAKVTVLTSHTAQNTYHRTIQNDFSIHLRYGTNSRLDLIKDNPRLATQSESLDSHNDI